MAVQTPNTTQFYAIPMAILASTILPSVADRPVVDKTGLTGYYDLALPSSALRRSPPPPPPTAAPPLDAPSSSLEDESIFTALPAALGLRLEPAKGRVETLLIDQVERPSENDLANHGLETTAAGCSKSSTDVGRLFRFNHESHHFVRPPVCGRFGGFPQR